MISIWHSSAIFFMTYFYRAEQFPESATGISILSKIVFIQIYQKFVNNDIEFSFTLIQIYKNPFNVKYI